MYYKNKQEEIICTAIEDCKNKTIQQMKELYNDNELYNNKITVMINERLQDLNYTDGTGSLYT